MADLTIEELVLRLHGAEAIRFGEFMLKDGRRSPFYLDLRVLIAYPDLLRQVARAMLRCTAALRYDCLAGIPYAGLPLAVAMSLESGAPLIYPRKDAKAYGTQRRIEGVFRVGDTALVVDDVITTGGAKIEAIQPLRQAGVLVEDIVVVVDREQSGGRALTAAGVRLHSVLSIRVVLDQLRRAGCVGEAEIARALAFLGD